MTDKAETLTNVFWLSGGSCAGKSAISQMLAINHGFRRYDGDPGAPMRFLREGRMDHIPHLKRLRETLAASASLRWFYELPPQELVEIYMKFSTCSIPLIAEELAQKTGNDPLVVDTLYGQPSSLLTIAPLERTVFIAADRAFQRRELDARPWPRMRTG